MKFTKQQLKQIIKEEIESLLEGSPFQEKTKSAQKEFQDSRPWTVNVLASFSEGHMDEPVPHTLRRFLSSSGANVVHEDYRSEWIKRGHRVYDLDYIKNGGLQGIRGPLILKIIEDAFSFPLQPYVDGEGRETPRENALESDPLVSRPQFATDPDGKRYITFTTKSGSWVVIDTPPRDTPSQDPQPGITIGPAPAGQGLAENKMKLTKQQLKHIIEEEIESLLEQEQDSVENMIYRFMENGAEITDLQATDWIQPAVDPRTASIERDGKQIARIINDAFVTKEINRDRNDKPGRLDGGATLQKTEDGMPYVVFNVLGNRDVPDMLYRVVDNPDGGIIIEPAPERMNYNEALEQIIKEEIINVLESAFSGNGPLSEPIEEADETFEREVDEDRVYNIRKIMAKDPNIPRELDEATITRYEEEGHNRREVVYAAEQLGLVEDVRDFIGPDPNEEPWKGGSDRTTQQRDPDDPMWSRGWYGDDE